MKDIKFLYAALILILFVACGGNSKQEGGNLADQASGDMATYENSAVNGVTQALPTIMILPSDQTLQNFGALQSKNIDGRNFLMRDYQKY